MNGTEGFGSLPLDTQSECSLPSPVSASAHCTLAAYGSAAGFGMTGRRTGGRGVGAALMVTAPSSGRPTPDFAVVPRPAPRGAINVGYAVTVGRVTAAVSPPGQSSVPASDALPPYSFSHSTRPRSTSTATTRLELAPK